MAESLRCDEGRRMPPPEDDPAAAGAGTGRPTEPSKL